MTSGRESVAAKAAARFPLTTSTVVRSPLLLLYHLNGAVRTLVGAYPASLAVGQIDPVS